LQPENRRRQRAQTSNRRDCCFNHFLGRRRGPVGGRGMLCRGGVTWGWRRRGQTAGTRHHSGATLLRDYVSSFDSSDPTFLLFLCAEYIHFQHRSPFRGRRPRRRRRRAATAGAVATLRPVPGIPRSPATSTARQRVVA
jgi:hypothetical protein